MQNIQFVDWVPGYPLVAGPVRRKKFSTFAVVAATVFSLVAGNALWFSYPTSAHEGLFSDGFESGDFSNWSSADAPKWDTVNNAENAYSGNVRAEVKGNTGGEDDILRKTQPTEDHENISLSFWYKIDEQFEGEEDGQDDYVAAEYTLNGEDWITFETYTGAPTPWTWQEFFFGGAADNADFQFRFRAHLSAGSDVFWLDDVLLTGTDIQEESENGAIHAFKFYDVDADGVYDEDAGDFPLNNWEICIEGEAWGGDCQQTGQDGEDGWVWWMDLPPDEYDIWEELPEGWEATTRDFVTEQLDEGEELEMFFGNHVPGSGDLHVRKFYDLDQSGTWDWIDENENGQWDWGEGEMPIPGWQMCIEPDDLDEDSFWDIWYALFDPDQEDQNCQLTNEKGLVWWMGLPPGDYEVWEDGGGGDWEQTVPDGSYEVRIDEEGTVWFWDEDEEGGWVEADILLFGNWAEPGEIRAVKYTIADLELWEQLLEWEEGEEDPLEFLVLVPGWEMCLYRQAGWENDEPVWALIDCERTDGDGLVRWTGLPPGQYQVREEERAGWDLLWPFGQPVQEVELWPWGGWEGEREFGRGEFWPTAIFVNFREDSEPPISRFDEDVQKNLDHAVIDTEIVALELRGTSTDNHAITPEGGNVEVRAHQLAGEFFVDSFFDVFTELQFNGPPRIFSEGEGFFDVFHNISCDTILERNPIPPELGGNVDIPIELVALSLQSVDPIIVQWNGNWNLSAPGVYCFEASATDNAGNVERTAWVGPVLVHEPAPVIGEESILEQAIEATSAVIEWITDHLSTSRVIYDTVSHLELVDGPCPPPLDFLNCYGYASSTPESDIGTEEDPMVTEHSVTVNGLAPGTTYYYRSVSHGSPEGVSNEQTFSTTAPPPQTAGPTSSASFPQCADNRDNDGDGKVDAQDPGCLGTNDNDESNPVSPPPPPPPPPFTPSEVEGPPAPPASSGSEGTPPSSRTTGSGTASGAESQESGGEVLGFAAPQETSATETAPEVTTESPSPANEVPAEDTQKPSLLAALLGFANAWLWWIFAAVVILGGGWYLRLRAKQQK